MAPSKMMIIRHVEKPDGSIQGVAQDGSTDPEELTVQGWQRSGALVRFFKPAAGQFTNPALATPNVIFASAVAKHSNSLRPQHTVLALANFLGLELNLDHLEGDEAALITDVLKQTGSVLIAWEHEKIPTIAAGFVLTNPPVPQQWPGERFDLVWVFDRNPDASGWTFAQVPQMLLSGDGDSVIPLS